MQNYRADDGSTYKNEDNTVRSVEETQRTLNEITATDFDSVEVSFGAIQLIPGRYWLLAIQKFEMTRYRRYFSMMTRKVSIKQPLLGDSEDHVMAAYTHVQNTRASVWVWKTE